MASSSLCVALALAPALWGQTTDAAAVLRKTAEKYANLTSTSFRASTTVIDENQRDAMTMEIALRRPDKARFVVRGTGVGQAFGFPANEVHVVVDGLYTWMTVPDWKQYTREAGGLVPIEAGAASPVKLNAAAGFLSRMIASIEALVKQYAKDANKMKLVGEDTVNNVECYVIESKSPKPSLKRLWIDKARFVLVQEETTAKNGAILRTSFSDMSVNEPLPDSLFTFTPADGAVLVQNLAPPDRQ